MERAEARVYRQSKGRKGKDAAVRLLIGLAAAFTIGILALILGYLIFQGISKLRWDFFTRDFDSKSYILSVTPAETAESENLLGVELTEQEISGKRKYLIEEIVAASPLRQAQTKTVEKDASGKSVYVYRSFSVKAGMWLESVGGRDLSGLTPQEMEALLQALPTQPINIKVTERGEGIFPMLVTTLLIIVLAIGISAPIGIFGAIYLNEYAKPGKMVRLIRFGIESLAGIPSIIYGLFGMLFFVTMLKMGLSVLAGACTLSIILMPIMIRQTEESLKTVPDSYREASLGLGATKLQTILRVVLPPALPGIAVGVILSIGRVVGESAALLLTAGTTARIPQSLWESGATLTIKAYTVAKEEGNYELASAIGIVLIVLVLIVNFVTKAIIQKLGQGAEK